MTEMSYGRQSDDINDELVRSADKAITELIRIATPGASLFGILVELLPIRKFEPSLVPTQLLRR